jgi:hypothetical protein
MLKLGAAEFREAYDALLAGLDPDEVAAGVGDGSVMLCWESDPRACHRAIVAEYLRRASYAVEEWELPELQLRLF